MNLPSISRLLVTAVVSVVALVAFASPASAQLSSTYTIGTTDLNNAVMPFGTDDETFVNQTLPMGDVPSIGDSGHITKWRANVLSTGPVRLGVVHPTGAPGEYTVTAIDDQVAGQIGVNEFTPSSPLPIAAGDTIALIQIAGGAVPRYANDPSTTFWVKSGAISPMTPTAGQTFTAPVAPSGAVLFNADIDVTPPAPATPDISGNAAFPETTVGQASAETTFTVKNDSGPSLVLGAHAITLSAGDTGDFQITGDTCSSHTITTHHTCTVKVRFKPTSAGAKMAKLKVSSNAATPALKSITGTAKAPVVVEPPKNDPPKPAPTPEPTPEPVKPAPTLQAIVGGGATGPDGTSRNAAITVQRDAVGVGCAVTGTVLTSCKVELYANVTGSGKQARASRLVHVGTGTYVSRTGNEKLQVKVVLNAVGRRLLKQSPGGLKVRVKITGTPTSGAKLEATGAARLVPRNIAASVGGFRVDGTRLTVAAKRRLRTLAGQIGTAKTVTCVGHTDGSSDDSSYLGKLGLKRAKAVCAQLAKLGVKAKFVARSKGASAPKATNRTKAGRAANRRVELRVAR